MFEALRSSKIPNKVEHAICWSELRNFVGRNKLLRKLCVPEVYRSKLLSSGKRKISNIEILRYQTSKRNSYPRNCCINENTGYKYNKRGYTTLRPVPDKLTCSTLMTCSQDLLNTPSVPEIPSPSTKSRVSLKGTFSGMCSS